VVGSQEYELNVLHATTDPDLLTRLKQMLGSANAADIAVGYFFVSGFEAVADEITRRDRRPTATHFLPLGRFHLDSPSDRCIMRCTGMRPTLHHRLRGWYAFLLSLRLGVRSASP